MFHPLTVVIAIGLFVCLPFAIGLWGERSPRARALVERPWVYSLSLAVYCTSWTFYGSVGKAVDSGAIFLAIYIGPALVFLLGWPLLLRVIRLHHAHRFTSVVDCISARYRKSQSVAALATLGLVVGILPYIGLQLKSILTTYTILTGKGAGSLVGRLAEPLGVLLLIVFVILTGVRRIEPSERHPGIVAAVAALSLVKLAAFLLAGAFVCYGLFDGVADLFSRMDEVGFTLAGGLRPADAAPTGLAWAVYCLVAGVAVVLLPRQFHLLVVENAHEGQLMAARWQFPLFLLVINLFVLPVALAGLLSGLPKEKADYFMLLLPLQAGQGWLSLIVFLGGLSAAASMVMISSLAIATMLTNHILLPLAGMAPWLAFLQRRVLACRWGAVALLVLAAYVLELTLSDSFSLVNIGLISFVAAFQLAPALVAGLFWSEGNKTGALCGLVGGFLMWGYTLFFPALAASGLFGAEVLSEGPWGIGFLRPQALFGVDFGDPIVHSVVWCLCVNLGLYVLGSLFGSQSSEEKNLALEFTASGNSAEALLQLRPMQPTITLANKYERVTTLLSLFFDPARVEELAAECLHKAGLDGVSQISVVQLAALQSEVEKALAAAMGAATARRAVNRAELFTPRETQQLADAYVEILARLKVPPEELTRKIDFYQERANLLERHARELETRIAEREQEIAERKQTEIALQRAEQKYRRIFEHALEGIFQIGPEGRVVNANPAMAGALGFNSADELMETVNDFRTQCVAEPERFDLFRHRLLEQSRVANFEIELKRHDGATFWAALNGHSVFDKDGQLLFVEGALENISERKKAETLLKAKLAAEAANQAKSEFLARMSHEIRTPLNAMLGMADLLWEGELASDQRRLVSIFREAGEGLLQIINDILDFSKIESGQLVLEVAPFNLRDVVEKICNALAPRGHAKGLELACHVAPDVPVMLVGDQNRLQQVLFNLVDNAIKFTSQGEVVLHIENDPERNVPGALLGLVWDTGVGVQENKRQAIFESFAQADSSTTRIHGGTGLGLSICKRLVEIMGGRIWVQSDPGKGSMFFFTAHFALQPLSEKDQLDQFDGLAGLNALVHCPRRAARHPLLQDLNAWQMRVQLVETKNQALEALDLSKGGAAAPFDVCLIECLGAGETGLGFATALRERMPELPLILLAATTGESFRAAAAPLGRVSVVHKPISRRELAQALFNACGVVLPVALESVSVLETAPAVGVPMRILLAEDSENNRLLIEFYLEKTAHTLEIATNGQIALDMFTARAYDCVFMDMEMPVMDGYTATRAIRTFEREQGRPATPIIAITAHAFGGWRDKCLGAGCSEYLSKPVKKKILLDTLDKLCLKKKTPLLGLVTSPSAPENLPPPQPRAPATTPGRFTARVEAELEDLIPRFKDLTRKDVANMRAALDIGDFETVRRLGHSLKGAGLGYGFEVLSQIGQRIEQAAKAANAAQILAALSDILEYLDQVKIEYYSEDA